MKRSPFLVLLVVFFSFTHVFSQVGIGTASPNQKAVLELKSPGNNQGFLVPRLTTVQRTGMAGLSTAEKGLLVFDSDVNKFHYWNGSLWIVIDTGTDTQTLSFDPTTGLLTIAGGNNVTVTGTTPGGSAGGDLIGTYPNPTVAANAITGAKLQSDATVDANRAVATNHIRDNAITTTKISDGTIVVGDLADGAVTSAKLLDGAVTNADINASAAIAVTKFAAGTNGQVLTTVAGVPTWNTPASGGSVTNVATGTGLTGGPITTTGTISIADAGVSTIKVADDAITSAKLQDDATIDANRAVNTDHIRDNSVTSAKIANGAILGIDLADAIISTAKIVDGAISTLKIVDGAISTAKIADAAVNTLKLADNAVNSLKLADNAVTSLKLVDNAVTSVKIADGTIATADIVDGAINTAKILDGTIASADILDGTIATADILDGTIGTLDIGNNAITNGKIADNAINSVKIADGTIATADLLDGAITSAKVFDGTIGTADIAAAAITDAKIATGIDIAKLTPAASTGFVLTTVLGNVTWAALPVLGLGTVTSVATSGGLTGGTITTTGTISIADGGVSTIKVADDAITSAKLQDDAITDANRAVTTNHIRDAAVTSAKILDGTVSSADITNGTIATVDVLDDAISSAKLQDDAVTDANRAVTTNHIRDNAIVSAKITDGTIVVGDLADGAVTTAKILDGTVSSTDITNGTIATADVADGAITDIKIATGITASKVSPSGSNGQVLTTVAGATAWADLPPSGTGTVTSVATGTGLTGGPITTTGTISIAANGVTATELRSDATTDALRAVGTNHIQDGAVNSAKILNASILNADISASAAVAVTKLAASAANGDVLTTVLGTPTWQAPVDNSATNEIQGLSSVLTQGNNAGGATAINFSGLSVNRTDVPGALNVTGSHYVSFNALGAITAYTVGVNDYIIIGTATPGVITNVTLPDASTSIGRILILKGRSIGSASAAGLQPVLSGTDTLDGGTNPPILTPVGTSYTTLTIVAIGANEWITLNRTHN